MNRRSVVRMLGMGMGVAVTSPAWAQRIRILPGSGGAGSAAGSDTAADDVRCHLEGVRVGEHRAYGGLTVFWLHAPAAPALFAIATLDEALAKGGFFVTERDQAAVSSLVVENRGPAHVVLLAGEILQGGKQNRIVTTDVLVPPKSGPLSLPVYCVEQGRWRGAGKQFITRQTLAAPRLREQMLAGSDQQKVWAEVHRYAERAAAPSATASYQAIPEKPEVQAKQKDVEAVLGGKIPPGARGAAVFVGNALAGIDVFQDDSLFAREWSKLLRASTIDAYVGRIADSEEARLRATLDELLRLATGADGTVRRGAGAGWLVELSMSRAKGSALVAERQVVHLAMI